MFIGAMKTPAQDNPEKQQEHLKEQRDILAYRMKKLSAKQEHFIKKTAELKEKIRKKYEDMKRVLDEDLRITMCQLDMEQEAMERTTEENIEKCFQLMQDMEEQLSETVKQLNQDKAHDLDQVPVTKKLFQSYAQEVVLNPDSAHPKLIISPAGDSVTYTDTWQEVPENWSRFDTTLNVISQEGFKEGRNYWEAQVSGKTYWELGLTYPSIPRKGREEQCWLGRGPESWCVEYFNGDYTAWHNGVPHELTHLTGRKFQRIGVFSSSYGGLVCFLGSDTMTPLYSFCVGTFTDALHQAVCPGHDNQGTNWKPLLICDASRSAPTL